MLSSDVALLVASLVVVANVAIATTPEVDASSASWSNTSRGGEVVVTTPSIGWSGSSGVVITTATEHFDGLMCVGVCVL